MILTALRRKAVAFVNTHDDPDPNALAAEFAATLTRRERQDLVLHGSIDLLGEAVRHRRKPVQRARREGVPWTRAVSERDILDTPYYVPDVGYKRLGDLNVAEVEALAHDYAARAEEARAEADRFEQLVKLMRRRRVSTVGELAEREGGLPWAA